MRIGIFDTGRGGVLVAERLRKALPGNDYLVVDDTQFMPYGQRSQMAIAHLTDRAIQSLLANKCDAIVIACGAATAAAIEYLRGRYPEQTFIGFEPMVAAAIELSHAKRVSVLAAPSTLKSDLYRSHLKSHTGEASLHHPECRGWATAIERGELPVDFDDVVNEIIVHGSDIILLLCTHSLALQEELQARTGLRIIEPSTMIARQLAGVAHAKPHVRPADRNITVKKKPARPATKTTRRAS